MILEKKRILVTGARGFLGRAVLAEMKKRGVLEKNIIAHSREMGDLQTKAACEEATRGVNVVIHLAGITGGVVFHREHAKRVYEENLTMGINVIAAALKSGAEKFVMAGSLTEYGMDAPLPYREESLWDGEPRPAHAAYARAKRAILKEAVKLRAKRLQSAHLLLASMYGPGEKSDFVIPKLIRKIIAAKSERTPRIVERGTGTTTRDFLHVGDAAEAIVLAAERYDSDEPLNIATGRETSIRELATIIARVLGYESEIVFNGQDERVERVVADISRAKKELGWSPKVSLEEGIRKTAEWHARQA